MAVTVTPERNRPFACSIKGALAHRCGTLSGSTPSHPRGAVHVLRPARCHDNQTPRRVPSGITAGQAGFGAVTPLWSYAAPKRYSACRPVHCIAQIQGVAGRMSRWEAV